MSAPALPPVEGQPGIPPSWVDMNGRLVPGAEATVSVFNHGFLFGDSVYEVLRTYGGRPFLAQEHLDRLERSAAAISLPLPLSREELVSRIERLVGRSGFPECYVRVIVSRGTGEPNIDPARAGPPETLLIAAPLKVPPREAYERGVEVALVGVRRTASADVKSGNYLNSVLAILEARRRGAFEGLMLNDAGRLTEASTSNVFLALRGRLVTPDLASGILEGITRRHVLELARRHAVPVEERSVSPDELAGADEAFLSSTLKEVLPIRSVDGRALFRCPGPLTRRLAELYRREVVGAAAAGPA